MKKYTDIIKEQKGENLNDHNGILVIVDVQRVFSKFIPKDFEKKLNLYCKNFNRVYQIWDSNKTNKPSYKFDNQHKLIRKNYGTKFSDKLVEITKKIENENPNVKEGDVFKVGKKNYVVRINNNHKWFYLNDEMVDLYKELKDKKVIIVGGADLECITDIFISMRSFGIHAIYNHDYIYSAKTSNKQQATMNYNRIRY